MSGKGMPIRGGNRGGQDQFDWEDVKTDKERENYLGHSLKASVGRWQKGRDLTWYTKKSKISTGHSNHLKEELAALKRAEEEAMAAALGLKPPAPVNPQQALSKQEMSEVCRRRSKDEMEDGEERIKGIGFQSRRAQAMFIGNKSTTTKEGATIFEHDSEIRDDGRLKMPESKRQSLSDITSPTSLTPLDKDTPHTEESKPVVTMTIPPPHKNNEDDTFKGSRKIKKQKKHKKEKSHSKHSRISSPSAESDSSWVETKKKHGKSKKHEEHSKLKKKRKRRESSEKEWSEKPAHKVVHSKRTRSHSRSRSPNSRSNRRRPKRHDSSSSSSSSSEEDKRKSIKRRDRGEEGRRGREEEGRRGREERPRYQRQTDDRKYDKGRDHHRR